MQALIFFPLSAILAHCAEALAIMEEEEAGYALKTAVGANDLKG